MEGYTALSAAVGAYPDTAMVRRFLPLNVRNILCMQAELIRLEGDLQMTIEDDRNSGDAKRSQYEYNVGLMMGPHEHHVDGLQWQKTLAARRLLKDYNEAVLQLSSLLQRPPVSEDDLTCFRELIGKPYGSRRPFMQSIEYFAYDRKHLKDFTLLAGHTKDVLTRWIDKFVRNVFHRYVGYRTRDPISAVEAGNYHGKPPPVVYYDDRRIAGAVDAAATILASALPTLSAFGLYFIQSPLARMFAIVACTLLFSTVLTLIAKPRRVETFGASSAFAAVLVVFVQSSNGGPVCPG
ncbi:hypothetical protein LTR99_004728 [Exophiala xenobiotica]|uniref:DUF6594 domain-containing protein n=1 Tax=Vermiconidia calcicola TaxID=1690605 RepID=A0AAV9QEA2_9PEZI|nr:hypothetical protein LTR72_004350 [Exophiala xenobiotica]KAK5531715.1 hypothetical protein LTR23_009831 [Chaetothyriales sp. CCFEE 6169]KAK5540009.1 hypothetical protein LTR25_003714 [Vermiconidia calcicola]KAK5237559.1 hypothetical protein LTR47_001825 [Exophiala xenobiotica]KAK5257688.1 hypothetical protein LTR40_009394 [Exophiala xenobiotica]